MYEGSTRIGAVDTYSATTQTRVVLFNRVWASTTARTITIRPRGTAGRPNVLLDGSLDYEDSVLEQLDWIVASLHTSFRLDEPEQIERVIVDRAVASDSSARRECISTLCRRPLTDPPVRQ